MKKSMLTLLAVAFGITPEFLLRLRSTASALHIATHPNGSEEVNTKADGVTRIKAIYPEGGNLHAALWSFGYEAGATDVAGGIFGDPSEEVLNFDTIRDAIKEEFGERTWTPEDITGEDELSNFIYNTYYAKMLEAQPA